MDKMDLCARCAQIGKTCCQLTEIHVTVGDVKRIAAFSSRIDFYEFRSPVDPDYAADDSDPLWQRLVFRPDGSRRVLKHQESGDCFFLGPRGCQLSLAARPLICRLHPYLYDAKGIRDGLLDNRCPTHLLPPEDTLLATLGMSPGEARTWHNTLYVEINLSDGDLLSENWTDLRPAV
jgi:Fe-S-cluster containining protein